MAGTYKIMIADDFPILREDLAEVIKEQQGDRGFSGRYGL